MGRKAWVEGKHFKVEDEDGNLFVFAGTPMGTTLALVETETKVLKTPPDEDGRVREAHKVAIALAELGGFTF